MADISKITLPNGTTYNLKDEVARAGASAGLTITVVDTLPSASASTMGAIYLVKDSTHTGANDVYDEYVTVSVNDAYSWEKLGNTDIDLSKYCKAAHIHNFTAPAQSIAYTPEGTVTAPSVTVAAKDTAGETATIYSMSSAGNVTTGKAATFTAGSFDAGTLPAWTASVAGETLSFAWSAGTLPSHGKDAFTTNTPTAVTLPTRTQINVTATASAPTFTGKSASIDVKSQNSITDEALEIEIIPGTGLPNINIPGIDDGDAGTPGTGTIVTPPAVD